MACNAPLSSFKPASEMAATLAMIATSAMLAGCEAQRPGSETGAASEQAQREPQPQFLTQPRRIVSLDYCADQYVLKLVERDRILAVSPDAGRDFSYMRDAATDLPTVRPVAEDVIALEPDLVVRSYGGGPRGALLFERAGVSVYNLRWARNIDEILVAIGDAAVALGSPARGVAVADEMRTRLTSLRTSRDDGGDGGDGTDVLYMTPTGVTTGPGSLIHEMLATAGLVNFQSRPGWWPIPLERLAYEQPDLLAVAFHEGLADHPHVWSAIRHPVARTLLEGETVIPVDGAWTACGAWFLMDAVESLARAAEAGAGRNRATAPDRGVRDRPAPP